MTKVVKIKYEASWWLDGTIESMRFESQKKAFDMAKEYAKTTCAFLKKLTWTADGRLETKTVKVNANGTWKLM